MILSPGGYIFYAVHKISLLLIFKLPREQPSGDSNECGEQARRGSANCDAQ
jgi:hypothetical protein